jgi:pimeloyl-ACP methyl ester carboxylesterase
VVEIDHAHAARSWRIRAKSIARPAPTVTSSVGDTEGGRMAVDGTTFERDRLAVFARNGFEGESRRLRDARGATTYAIERGEGPCPTVLVHGGLSQASEWAPLAGRLPGHVVVPDRPGCGLSDPVDYLGADYRAEAVRWLRAVADGLGAERLDLVGNSMGGYFAIAFAAAHPERVRRLVLVGAPAGLDRPLPLFVRLWGNPLAGRAVSRRPIADPETFRRRVVGPLLAAHPERVPVDELELMVAAAALPGAARAAFTMLRTVTTLRGFRPGLMLREDAAALPTPTLFVWGDADVFAPPSSGAELVARMADGRLEVIADAGHLPHLDRPDAVASAVAGFLQERRRPAAAVGAAGGGS